MTKLVKVDSSIESSSREFAARLVEMLGSPAAENKPAVVRQKPTGPKLSLCAGAHMANLYAVRAELADTRRGSRGCIVFDMEVVKSLTMPVLGLVEYRIFIDSLAGPTMAKSTLESVGLLDEFMAASGSGKGITCNKYVTVTCVERPTMSGKFMSVKMQVFAE